MTIGPLRKVYRQTPDGEEGPFDLLRIKTGDTFRMEPACGMIAFARRGGWWPCRTV